MTPQSTHRVVGVRHGGTRVMLADALTLERAEHVRNVLIDLVAFQEIVVEAEGGATESLPLWRA